MSEVIIFGQGDEQPDTEKQLGFFDYVDLANVKIKNHKEAIKLAIFTEEHTCIYCGCVTTQPDSECYKNPNK